MRVISHWFLLAVFTFSCGWLLEEFLRLGDRSSVIRFLEPLALTVTLALILYFLEQGRTFDARERAARAERECLRQRGAPVE